MAAKLLHSLADDSADLQKKIGCMNGIFQIFDRHQALRGRTKSLTLGNSNVNSINYERDSVDSCDQQKDDDLNNGGTVKEKQRVSTESPRVSFSSSCSSSPSSSEFNRGVKPEASGHFSESPASDLEMTEGTGSSHLGLDLRGVVRDSMYRDARGVLIKTPMTSRRMDSPRPYGLKQSTPVDLNESFKVLPKFRETSQQYNEAGVKDAPRYSVDSCDTLKCSQKLKELPRLSLDSRDRVARNGVGESFSESCSSSKKRPPSVVAKLMGLETMPGSPSSKDIHQFGLNKTNTLDQNDDPFSRSSREKNLNHAIRFSPSSSRSLGKDPASPRWRNSDFVMKPLSNTRLPVEPAPWKQTDRNLVLQKKASTPVKAQPCEAPNFSTTVYSEMERRLDYLEFKHSGKDLRALKQILTSMQSKGFMDDEKQLQSSNFAAQRDNSASSNRAMPSRTKVQSSSSSSNQLNQSPIVIMKPAKLVEKAGIPASSLIPIHNITGFNKIRGEKPDEKVTAASNKRVTKDRSPEDRRAESCTSSFGKKPDSRNVRSSSKKPQQSSGSVSPRVQQKKHEYDRRLRPPTSPDSSKSKKPSNQQLVESTSLGGRRKPKAQKNFQQNDDQYIQASNESMTSSHDICTQSETEASACVEKATEADSGNSPSVIKTAKAVVSNLMQNTSSPSFSEDANVSLEHPSPISVLDSSMYRETEPSPVKTQGNVAHDSGEEHSEDQWNPAYSFSENTSTFSPEINRKKLQNVEHLVQKLRRLNSSHDDASQDYIGSLCENADPTANDRYISEILLASGLLLRDLGSGLITFQLHPSGHPINPELFFVLEQTKGSNNTKHRLHKEESKFLKDEKLNRKLVFDTVNEILVEKLALVEATTNPLMKMTKKAMNAQQLLKELCSEIETLQKQEKKRSENFLLKEEDDFLKTILAEDVKIRSRKWVDFSGEISGLVLDVERLLFKDLVSEIVNAEISRLQAKSGRRRMLFADQ